MSVLLRSGRWACRALSFNALCYVACHGDRAKHFASSVAFYDCKGHLDIKPAPALVQGSRQRGPSLEFQSTLRQCCIEAAPVCGSEVLWNDQVKALAERLFCRKAKQRRTGVVPPNDFPLVVGADKSVSDLVQYVFG
jgi:hypothetical protein